MSSPFQKSFSAKSPITTSPLRAGGYASGADGMRYVSPKQPVSNTPKATKATKEKENSLEPVEGVNEMEDLINKDKDKRDEILLNAANEKKLPSIKLLTQNRTINRKESGKAIIVETDQKKYLKSFEAGFAKNNEGFDNITDYRKNREKQNAAKEFEQDQARINEYTTDIAGVETLTREGEYVNVGKERQIR
tara:strand:- start:51 stop:626 length:576 start_codon:yes stop_codon:yes gene_type:complete